MFTRPENTQEAEINVCGGNVFGRYPKISLESTYNLFLSDDWLVTYAGYIKGIADSSFGGGNGRGFYSSENFGKMVAVIGANVYFITITFDQVMQKVTASSVTLIGTLQTSAGIVWITENNKPQLLFSDNANLYTYDPAVSPSVQVVTGLDFTPGYIDFHDTYFLAAAQNTSTWRLSTSNDGHLAADWPNDAQHVGALQTKPDLVQAVVRFPSRGNEILVFGKTVTEVWFDVGASLFPYNRSNSYSIDYGCLSPATIASMDEIVVWLAVNEKSGPVIMYSTGQMPTRITTDGIDYLFSNINHPEDSQAFLFRQDGHILYHINFYTDNFSLFYDFNTQKFFYATDEKSNVFIASKLAFFNNQYYFISNQNGNIYVFDTIFTTYDGFEIPRTRICKNIRLPSQDYFICTDVGFTIETGETPYIYENVGDVDLITQDGKFLITQSGIMLLLQQQGIIPITPRVDMSISIDGGESFGSYVPQVLPAIGQGKNKLMWWQIGAANDLICQFRFWGIGRFICFNGQASIRT